MSFKFHINLNDKDYLDYNIFWNLKSPYGKKSMTSIRIMLALVFGLMILTTLLEGSFSLEMWISISLYVILLVVFQVAFNKMFIAFLKGHIKALKKKGKMGYSPVSTIQFLEESVMEETPENKTEAKYSAIERVSIIAGKVIYIHVNNVMAYIMPLSCFESTAQYESFLSFIKTKCAQIDIYI